MDDGSPADLVLLGPVGESGRRPSLTVFVTADSAPVADVAARQWEAMKARSPESLLTNDDLWPHPIWGEGRLLQTARVEGESALARDMYLFSAQGRSVRVEVECPLSDLLSIEEQVADIVARIRLVV